MDRAPSRFMRKTLLPDEKCVREAHFSPAYTGQAWTTMILWILAGYFLQQMGVRYLGVNSPYPVAACAFIGLWVFAAMMMKKWTTEILITNERVIYKRGFFEVEINEVDIEQLASDNVVQGFLGRLLDYGEINIRCIEAPDFRLPAIAQPYEFRNALEKQKHEYRENYMRVERLRRHGSGNGEDNNGTH